MRKLDTIADEQDTDEIQQPFVMIWFAALVVFVVVLFGWYVLLWLVS